MLLLKSPCSSYPAPENLRGKLRKLPVTVNVRVEGGVGEINLELGEALRSV